MTKEELEAITDGVHDAWLEVLTTGMGFGGDYPLSQELVMKAITEGVRLAFYDIMSEAVETP